MLLRESNSPAMKPAYHDLATWFNFVALMGEEKDLVLLVCKLLLLFLKQTYFKMGNVLTEDIIYELISKL